jgi:hypothetical protein
METLDMNSGVWPVDANSGHQQCPCTWETYPLDEYPPLLEENLSDSDSSLDSPAYGLYFNPVNVETQTEPILDSYDSSIAQTISEQVSYEWSYDENGQTTQVLSPGSAMTDSETASTHGHFVANGESSDEASQIYEEDDSIEDSEESYSSGTTATTTSNSVSDSPLQQKMMTTASGRPARGQARGEHLKQVHEMIRQVNSAVEPAVKVGKSSKPRENPKKRSRVEPDIRSVTLTREQLLTMSSEELDEFTARLKADHPLSAHEIREIKRQRRLIKNREYAQASRVKKKVVLSDLGSKFHEIESERTQLIQRVQILEQENASLRAQLNLPPSDRPSLPFLNNHSASGAATHSSHGNDPMMPPRAKRSRGRTPSATAAAIGGGISLFAIVLLALAVYSGGSARLPFSFGWNSAASPSPAPTSHPVSSTAGMKFKVHDNYNTFRTMDILTTDTDPTDNPDLLPDGSKQQQQLQASSNLPDSNIETSIPITSTMLTMDDLMASEEMIFSTNNISTETAEPEAVLAASR